MHSQKLFFLSEEAFSRTYYSAFNHDLDLPPMLKLKVDLHKTCIERDSNALVSLCPIYYSKREIVSHTWKVEHVPSIHNL